MQGVVRVVAARALATAAAAQRSVALGARWSLGAARGVAKMPATRLSISSSTAFVPRTAVLRARALFSTESKPPASGGDNNRNTSSNNAASTKEADDDAEDDRTPIPTPPVPSPELLKAATARLKAALAASIPFPESDAEGKVTEQAEMEYFARQMEFMDAFLNHPQLLVCASRADITAFAGLVPNHPEDHCSLAFSSEDTKELFVKTLKGIVEETDNADLSVENMIRSSKTRPFTGAQLLVITVSQLHSGHVKNPLRRILVDMGKGIDISAQMLDGCMQAHMLEETLKSLVQIPASERQTTQQQNQQELLESVMMPRHFLFNMGATAEARVEMVNRLLMFRGPDVYDIENDKHYMTVFASGLHLQLFTGLPQAELMNAIDEEKRFPGISVEELARTLRGGQGSNASSSSSNNNNNTSKDDKKKKVAYEGVLINPLSNDLSAIAADIERAPVLNLCRVIRTQDFWFA